MKTGDLIMHSGHELLDAIAFPKDTAGVGEIIKIYDPSVSGSDHVLCRFKKASNLLRIDGVWLLPICCIRLLSPLELLAYQFD